MDGDYTTPIPYFHSAAVPVIPSAVPSPDLFGNGHGSTRKGDER